MDFKCVPIPPRMADLKRDRRGYPVPYIVLVDDKGRPHFQINDERKVYDVRTKDLCGICGNRLFRGRWFVGGPGSAFHPHGWYIDPPMHTECLEYAMQVCPYLAVKRYQGRVDTKTLDPKDISDAVVIVDPTIDPNRPHLFVAVLCTKQELQERGLGQHYARPVRGHVLQYAYWKDGVKLDEKVGHAMAMDELRKLVEKEN